MAEKIKPSLELFLHGYSKNEKKDSREEVAFKQRKSKHLTELKKTLLMEKVKQIKKLFKKLIWDVKSVFYKADRITKTLLN